MTQKDFVQRFKRLWSKFSLELRLRLSFDIKGGIDTGFNARIISLLDWLFYIRRVHELKSEIENLETQLSQLNAEALMKSLTESSMAILKASLAQRYKAERPIIDSVKDLFNNGESVLADYPIILSTTFSSKTCFNSDILFDYVIMDEASQVSVETAYWP